MTFLSRTLNPIASMLVIAACASNPLTDVDTVPVRDVLRAIQCELAQFERDEAQRRRDAGRSVFDLRAAAVQVGFATATGRDGRFGITVAGVPAAGGILGGGLGASASSSASQDTVVRLDTRGDLGSTATMICALAEEGQVRPTGTLRDALLDLSGQLGSVGRPAGARSTQDGLVLNDVVITLKTSVTRGGSGNAAFSLGLVSISLGGGRTDSETQTIVISAVEAVSGPAHRPGLPAAPGSGTVLRRDDLGLLRLLPPALQ
jgi:hypothetical protein